MLHPAALDHTFAALADPTRRRILAHLSAGDHATVSDLARPLDISLPAVMKHLDVLERARLIRREKRGRTVFCGLEPKPLRDAMDWLAHYQAFWETRLDSLNDFLEETAWTPKPKT